MFSMRLCRNRSCREIFRTISKTSTDADAAGISMQERKFKDEKLEMNNSSQKRWMKQMHHNNLRALSSIHQTMVKPKSSTALASKEQARDFMALFPDIVRELTDAGGRQELPEVMRRFSRVLQYTVPTGKKNRGLMLISAYKLLEDPNKLTPENIRLASIMGWVVEMFQAFFLIVDDVMDGSESRRGVPCWYRQPGIGLSAINDGIMIENAIYNLVKRHLKGHPSYVPILELLHDVVFKTSMGQSLDSMCIDLDGKPKLDMFTMKRYEAIVRYKTGYYSFQMPIAVAMHLANMNDEEQHRQAKTILLEMGTFFQIQDDFLDCFGDPAITGKTGTDIQEGKCSWLAVVALQRANPAQRKTMEEHYGKHDPESVEKIRHLYEELSLPNTYAVYEEESFNIIRTHIQQISKGLPHKVFFRIMERLYKREC